MPKLYLGPMSLNLVKSVVEISNNNFPLGLIPSRRQIEWYGGYVNNWKTSEFCDFVKNKNKSIILQRDHGGARQGSLNDDGLESYSHDCEAGFHLIHIDPWKSVDNIDFAVEKTVENIKFINSINKDIFYEIGTEQAIFEYSPQEMEYFAAKVLENIGNLDKKVLYLVVQTGTRITSDKNIGIYDPEKMIEMVKICKKKSLLSKEHNGDYLSGCEISDRFKHGLDSINIAPEMGYNETNFIIKKLKARDHINKIDRWYDICLKSEKWKKWISHEEELNNKEKIIQITGHYTFSNPEFLKIKNEVDDGNLDHLIMQEHKNKILNIVKDIYKGINK